MWKKSGNKNSQRKVAGINRRLTVTIVYRMSSLWEFFSRPISPLSLTKHLIMPVQTSEASVAVMVVALVLAGIGEVLRMIVARLQIVVVRMTQAAVVTTAVVLTIRQVVHHLINKSL